MGASARLVGTEDGVDAGLPAWALAAVGFEYIGVEADGLVDFGGGRAAAADCFGEIETEGFGDDVEGRASGLDVGAGPSGVVAVSAVLGGFLHTGVLLSHWFCGR